MKQLQKAARLVLSLALTLAAVWGLALTASAAVDAPSLDFDQTGSVTLTLAEGGTALTDGAVTLYQVADLYLEDGDMAYSYTEAFSGCTETLDVTDTALPAALAGYVTDNGVSGTTAAVGADGTVTFDGLTLGLYLAVQTTPSTGYSASSPFLVTVPCAEGDAWVYAVDASPKVALSAEPETEPEPPEEPEPTPSTSSTTSTTLPQTGQLNWPVPVLAGSGLVLFAIGWWMTATDRRKEGHEV